MLSDQTKLALLAACLFACLSTLFTSSSFHMGSKDLRTLGVPVDRFCQEPRSRAKACLEGGGENVVKSKDASTADDGSGKSCNALLSQASRCEETLQRAYRHINMGGCAREIQALTVCEVEWCEDIKGNQEAEQACQKECSSVRRVLEDCIKGHVNAYFERNGLEENGTVKIK